MAQILQMESLILNTLQFRLAVVTPKHFMKRFTSAAASDETELQLVNVGALPAAPPSRSTHSTVLFFFFPLYTTYHIPHAPPA
jgi:hypothetical protein